MGPREALLCMARADVLVTSFSSLGWVSAVLHTGVVFHPDHKHARQSGGSTYWDLRSQYFDWAENWFRVSDVWERPDQIRSTFAAAKGATAAEELADELVE